MRITTDLQALAEAVDTDIKVEQDSIIQRPIFRASGGGDRQEYGPGPTVDVSYAVLEQNSGGALAASTASLMPQTTFTPMIPGLWGFTATVEYPQWLGIGWVKLSLYTNFWIASSIATEMPNNVDGNRTISVTGVNHFSGPGGNTVKAIFEANPIGTRAVFPMFSRSLTGFLLARD
jgi:hypothetical protein